MRLFSFNQLALRRKLMWIIMLTSGTALLLACLAFFGADLLNFRQRLLTDVTTHAEMAAGYVQTSLDFEEAVPAEGILSDLSMDDRLVAAIVFKQDGGVLAKYVRKGVSSALPLPDRPGSGHRFTLDYLELFHPIMSDSHVSGLLYLRAAAPGVRERLLRYAGISITVLFVSFSVAFILSARLQRVVSEPILSLARTAGRVGTEKNYALRAEKQGEDEIGVLIDGFNGMLREIQNRDGELRKAHDELERRVEERTAALSESNRRLRAEIIERRRVEESHEKLVWLVQNSRDFVALADLDGRMIFLNEEGRRLVGLTLDEDLQLRPMAEYFQFEPPDQFVGGVLPAIHSTGLWEGETHLKHLKTGRPVPVLLSAFLVRHRQEATPLCLAAVARDMTERLSLEAQLRQSQKMEAIGQLAAGVAHDFNNILTVVQGYTSLLLGQPNLNAETSSALNQVFTAADRASKLTAQLLAFSRKQVMQLKQVDCNELLSRVTGMLNRLLGEDITLQLNYASNLPCVKADPTMIEQVIVNLAVNARDAMPSGGRLSISSSFRRIEHEPLFPESDRRPGEYVSLMVADTGCGMDAATLGRIFEPFFTTKDVGKGTGLGLATVYGILKQHQGWIEVASEVGRGSTFVLFLPAAGHRGKTPQAEAPQLPEPMGGRETVLVVEDEPALRALARTVLESRGYSVREAGSGIEALELWKKHGAEIQLLLTDIVMPGGVNGCDLARRLLADRSDLKVIYTSGYSPESVGANLDLREGVNFLPKPYRPLTLARIVRNCLDGAKASPHPHPG